jgi:hypothetical protein
MKSWVKGFLPLLPHEAAEVQTGGIRLHHHVDQSHGQRRQQVRLGVEQLNRLGHAPAGVDFQRNPVDLDAAQRQLRDGKHVGVVIDDENFPFLLKHVLLRDDVVKINWASG